MPVFRSFSGLGIGMILASFQICGIMFRFRDRLKRSVKNWMAKGPRCFRCLIFMLSGPVELLLEALLMAS